jgi:hypothetical protein
MMKRVILAEFADTQGGHRLGLLNPETVLEYEDEDGEITKYNPGLLASQVFLWESFTKHVKETFYIAKKDPIVVLAVGDLTQGDKYANEWVSTRKSDQIDIALWNMKPWMQKPNVKTIRIAKGTAAHNFGEGTAEILLARLLKSEYPKKNIRALHHGLAKVGGITVDYSHHGPTTGGRNWLKGNEARYYLRSLMKDEFDEGNIPPNLVTRAHYHDYVQETLTLYHRGKYHTSQLTILPSYCLLDNHARQATKSVSKVRFGMVVYEIVDGKILSTIPMIERVDIRTQEKLA